MKRDRDYLRDLVLQMQREPDGTIYHVLLAAPLDEELKLDHHLELLVDQGLVAPKGDDGYRLTSSGHDAVEAIEKESFWLKLREASPREAYEILKPVGSSLAVNALSKLMGWN